MLSPDERARVEQTAMNQATDAQTGISIRFVKQWNTEPDRNVRCYDCYVSPGYLPWFQSQYGRPIWLTPADRAFLKVHRISDR